MMLTTLTMNNDQGQTHRPRKQLQLNKPTILDISTAALLGAFDNDLKQNGNQDHTTDNDDGIDWKDNFSVA